MNMNKIKGEVGGGKKEWEFRSNCLSLYFSTPGHVTGIFFFFVNVVKPVKLASNKIKKIVLGEVKES